MRQRSCGLPAPNRRLHGPDMPTQLRGEGHDSYESPGPWDASFDSVAQGRLIMGQIAKCNLGESQHVSCIKKSDGEMAQPRWKTAAQHASSEYRNNVARGPSSVLHGEISTSHCAGQGVGRSAHVPRDLSGLALSAPLFTRRDVTAPLNTTGL